MSSKPAMALMAAMILTATMAVPANGPEKMSGEMRQEQQPFRTIFKAGEGSWKAVLYRGGQVFNGEAAVSVCGRFNVRVPLPRPGAKRIFPFGTPVDEGNGNLRFVGMGEYLGIYEQDGDRLCICLGDAERRPTSFRAGDGRYLLVLHRVKRNK